MATMRLGEAPRKRGTKIPPSGPRRPWGSSGTGGGSWSCVDAEMFLVVSEVDGGTSVRPGFLFDTRSSYVKI